MRLIGYIVIGVLAVAGTLAAISMLGDESEYSRERDVRTLRRLGELASVFHTRRGSWPVSFEDMASPKCSGDTCLLTEVPVDEAGVPFEILRRVDGGAFVCGILTKRGLHSCSLANAPADGGVPVLP